jgi:hypothetical protein
MDKDAVVEWLLEGDPAIRWQVLRDLLDTPAREWEAERARTVEEGWVAELLRRQGDDGEWPEGRWTASTWTLLLLMACGVPEGHPSARAPIKRLLGRFMPPGEDVDPAFLLRRVDLCHLGFWLGLAAYFLPGDTRLRPLAEAVVSAQYEDGGWNCQMRTYPNRLHSSFNTTFNVLENLRIAAKRGVAPEGAFKTAETQAIEFMLAHRLYRSEDRRGNHRTLRAPHVSVALALHRAARARLPATNACDPRRAARRSDPPAARAASAQRPLAAAEAHPRNAPRRDGEARRREPVEHASRAPRAAPAIRRRIAGPGWTACPVWLST